MQFEELLILAIAAFTTILVYGIGRIFLGVTRGHIIAAVAGFMECVGAVLAFLALNATVGTVLVFALRSLMRRFVGLYLVENAMLVILSVVQGIVFVLWRRD